MHFENTRVQRVKPQGTTNANPVNDIQQKCKPDRTNIFFYKPKDDRTYGERVDDRWRLDTGAKQFGKTQSRWWKQRYNLGAISPGKAKKCKIEALKNLRGAKGNVWRREYVAVIRRQTTPHLHCRFLCPLTKRESIGEKEDVMGKQRKCIGRKRIS